MSARNKRANLCFCELFGFFFARVRVYLVGKRDFFLVFVFFVSNSNFYEWSLKNKKRQSYCGHAKRYNYVQFSLSRNIHRPQTDRISFNMHLFCVHILSRPRCVNYSRDCILFVRHFIYTTVPRFLYSSQITDPYAGWSPTVDSTTPPLPRDKSGFLSSRERIPPSMEVASG